MRSLIKQDLTREVMHRFLTYLSFGFLICVAISIFLIVVVSEHYPGLLVAGVDMGVREIGIGLLCVGALGAAIIAVRLVHALISLYSNS
jgi:hypothetical protein